MAIQTVEDSMTGETTYVVKGKVDGIYFNDLKNPIVGSNNRGQSWNFTQAINIVVDGTKLSVGFADEDKVKLNAKIKGGGEKDYAPLGVGMDVACRVSKQKDKQGNVKQYKGEDQWETKSSQIVLLNDNDCPPMIKGEAAPAPQGGNKGGGYSGGRKYGMECGHALNGAYRITGHKPKDSEEIVELAKAIHDTTLELIKIWAKAHPDLPEYDVGASVGNAVLNACGQLTKTKVGEVKDLALQMLDQEARLLMAYIKGEEVPAPSMQQQEEAPAPANAPDEDDPFA